MDIARMSTDEPIICSTKECCDLKDGDGGNAQPVISQTMDESTDLERSVQPIGSECRCCCLITPIADKELAYLGFCI